MSVYVPVYVYEAVSAAEACRNSHCARKPEPPERLGPLLLDRMGTYPGSLGRFAGDHLGLKVLTIELPSAGIMPSPDDQKKMWLDLVAWLRQNVPDTTQPSPVHVEAPAVTTAATGMGR